MQLKVLCKGLPLTQSLTSNTHFGLMAPLMMGQFLGLRALCADTSHYVDASIFA
jgi:hypothetical protein